jgi:hypothetical protein
MRWPPATPRSPGSSPPSCAFRTELEQFHNEKDLHPLGKKIIEACFKGASLAEYEALIEGEDFFVED